MSPPLLTNDKAKTGLPGKSESNSSVDAGLSVPDEAPLLLAVREGASTLLSGKKAKLGLAETDSTSEEIDGAKSHISPGIQTSIDAGISARNINPKLDPGVKAVMDLMPVDRHKRSTWKGVVIFLGVMSLYGLTMAGVLLFPNWWVKFGMAFLHEVTIAMLFIIGHDAVHGAFTPKPWLNRLLGTLALLPSVQPFSSWRYTHNGLHHGWTNVRGKDCIFVPLSLEEYQNLPRWRQWVERFYRSTAGVGSYYFFEVYLPYELSLVGQNKFQPKYGREFPLDRLLVLSFAACWAGGLAYWGWMTEGTLLAVLGYVAIGFVFPFGLWMYSFAWITYLQHTHETIPWYPNEKVWSYFRGQVNCSVHIELSWFFDKLLLNVMNHTAHHCDPKIPMYELIPSQASLENTLAYDVPRIQGSWWGYQKSLSCCRLYDYENHRWLNFDGTPTSPILLPTTTSAVEQHLKDIATAKV